ncbi:DUF4136 domain-containing protein [Polaribacter undariae]|uniref:DUF4136 domain-containing protein n=1 Tax=Polaribacter sejongensis TaxID=985043 RepID=A0AAJ1QXG2_9FLAO|nr:DUF4136 domain-containing protein [Polaribacter undariae]MDN3619900.1 DUF4136 domain-containing protein [Polaribacter undariae]UWD31662.1 DUF4136 domain-containing protein [Polaribacter undariae]
MKKIRYFFLLFLISCSSSKVVTDYDDNTNFTQYKTYAFFDDIGAGLNEFDVDRVADALFTEMEILGFKEVENPSFYINIIAKTAAAKVTNTIAVGLGSGGRNGGFGVSGGIPIGGKKLDEEIIVEFVDAKTNELFWEGVLTSTIKEKRTPEKRILYFKEVFHKILQSYPLK